jgi:ABC-type protease/lipase transport system fused ATPase/permease subunit
VLDEPNSNLDTDGEEALLKAMAALKKEGITVVLISHRPNLLRFVDRVLVLNKGRVHLFGSRDEILQKMTGKPAAPKAEAVATAKPSVRIAGKQEQGDG